MFPSAAPSSDSSDLPSEHPIRLPSSESSKVPSAAPSFISSLYPSAVPSRSPIMDSISADPSAATSIDVGASPSSVLSLDPSGASSLHPGRWLWTSSQRLMCRMRIRRRKEFRRRNPIQRSEGRGIKGSLSLCNIVIYEVYLLATSS